MEPDIMPFHSSSPPPLDDDDDNGELGSEDDDFGHFGGFSVVVSCSPHSFTDSPEPPSSLRQPSTSTKPATQQPNVSVSDPLEQSQPVSSMNWEVSSGQVDVDVAEPSSHLTNGYAERHHASGTPCSASEEGAGSPREEAGFADFTVFTEQAAHPWCCGFSPSTEQWDSRAEATNVAEQICDTQQDVIMDSEPRSHCAHKAKGNVCTTFKHCERIDAAIQDLSQDNHQPQEGAAEFGFRSMVPHLREQDEGQPGRCWAEGRRALICSSLQMSEVQEDTESEDDRKKSISNTPQTFSMCDSASASVCDDFSFEGVSADLEPNVSSFTSQEDQTDWDRTDDEDEDLEKYSHADSSNGIVGFSQSEAEKSFHNFNQSVTQETHFTSSICRSQTYSATHTEDEYTAFKNSSSEHQRDQEYVQTADVRAQSLGSLPLSDSFADFCSAPTQEDGDGSWAEFKDQRAQEEAQTSSKVSSPNTAEEKEQNGAGQCAGLKNHCQVGDFSCHRENNSLAPCFYLRCPPLITHHVFFYMARHHCCAVSSSSCRPVSHRQWSQLWMEGGSCSASML